MNKSASFNWDEADTLVTGQDPFKLHEEYEGQHKERCEFERHEFLADLERSGFSPTD